jgi:hypothetical protein
MVNKIISILRVRRGTAAKWRSSNPKLMEGECGLVTDGADKGKIKVGDGSGRWNDLDFTIGSRGPAGNNGPAGPAGPAIAETTLAPIPGSGVNKVIILGGNILQGQYSGRGDVIRFGPAFEGSIFIGADVLYNLPGSVSGVKDSVYIGRSSGQNTTAANSNNTVVGAAAFKDGAGGSNNVILGHCAGTRINGGSNTMVGAADERVYQVSRENCAAFGYNAENLLTASSNQMRLGDNQTNVYLGSGAQVTSDGRDKAEIRDTALGLKFIEALRPVDYKWDYRAGYAEYGYDEETGFRHEYKKERDGSKKRGRFHHGFIAQDIQKLIAETGRDFGGFQDHSINGGGEMMSLGYEEFIAPLARAVQELSARNKALEKRIAALEAKIENN